MRCKNNEKNQIHAPVFVVEGTIPCRPNQTITSFSQLWKQDFQISNFMTVVFSIKIAGVNVCSAGHDVILVCAYRWL